MTRRLPVWKVYERGTICQWKVYERGTICQWKMYETGIFSAKNGIKKGKGSDLGADPPRINFFCPPPPHPLLQSKLPPTFKTVAN